MKKGQISRKTIIQVIPVVAITLIACVGLIKAPSKASDHLADDLKNEFRQNQELLQQSDRQQQTPPETQEVSKEHEPENNFTTFVGDSVMLGAVPDLMEATPDSIIDAKESRQVVQAVDILKELDAQGKLGHKVVIELGINSCFSQSTGQEVIDYLGKDREIYWVNIYGKFLPEQQKTNDVIQALAKANDNVQVIAWDKVAEQHPDWFYNDGIHLNGEGRKGFAQTMCEALNIKPVTPEETREQ